MINFEKEINELWNSNSKIPFMQSKEILGLGYLTAANKYIKQKILKKNNQLYLLIMMIKKNIPLIKLKIK